MNDQQADYRENYNQLNEASLEMKSRLQEKDAKKAKVALFFQTIASIADNQQSYQAKYHQLLLAILALYKNTSQFFYQHDISSTANRSSLRLITEKILLNTLKIKLPENAKYSAGIRNINLKLGKERTKKASDIRKTCEPYDIEDRLYYLGLELSRQKERAIEQFKFRLLGGKKNLLSKNEKGVFEIEIEKHNPDHNTPMPARECKQQELPTKYIYGYSEEQVKILLAYSGVLDHTEATTKKEPRPIAEENKQMQDAVVPEQQQIEFDVLDGNGEFTQAYLELLDDQSDAASSDSDDSDAESTVSLSELQELIGNEKYEQSSCRFFAGRNNETNAEQKNQLQPSSS